MVSKHRLYLFVLTPNPQPNSGISGGAIKTLQTLAHFPHQKIEIHLVSCSLWHQLLNQHHIPHQYHQITPDISYSGKIQLSLISFFLTVKTLLTFKPKKNSYIYTSSDLFWDVFPAFYYRSISGSKITWVQNIYHVYPPWQSRPGFKIISFFGYYLQKITHHLIVKKADKILVLNHRTHQYLIRKGVPSSKILSTAIGIDHPFISQALPLKTHYAAAYLGRLDPSKGVLDLPHIWSQVVQKQPEAKLALIGSGGSYTEGQLRQLIKNLKLTDNIKLFGFVSTQKVYSILKSSSLFLFPSHEEGWGIALTEAMACGLPVICWDLPVYHEIYQKLPNYIPKFHYRLFAKKAISLLESPSKCQAQAKTNHQFSLDFQWQTVAQKEFSFIFKYANL